MASAEEKEYFATKKEYDISRETRDEARAKNDVTMDPPGEKVVLRRLNKFGKSISQNAKLVDISWHPIGTGSEIACIATQDGKAIAYNVKSGQKLHLNMLETWLNVCEYSPSGNQLALGGLDNLVSIYKTPDFSSEGEEEDKAIKIFEKHGGPIYDIKWLNETTVVSASGDKTALVWDMEKGGGLVKEPVSTFQGHDADVSTIATWGDANLFLTGSGDTYIKMCDRRVISKQNSGCVATFTGHKGSVTKIAMVPHDNNAFGSVSEDGTMRLWDIRTMTQIQQIREVGDGKDNKMSALAFSKSGRLAFIGTDNMVEIFDVLAGQKIQTAAHHQSKINTIEMSLDGYVCASVSADSEEKHNFALWA